MYFVEPIAQFIRFVTILFYIFPFCPRALILLVNLLDVDGDRSARYII
jgi:hypothetical protein